MVMKPVLLFLLAAVLTFAAVTLIALEGGEVVVLRTFGADSQARATRTWVADDQGSVLIEAANPEREFLRDIEQNPNVELVRKGSTLHLRATVLPQPLGHQSIRLLLRQKYGWADRWIAMLTDTSNSVAIRLDSE